MAAVRGSPGGAGLVWGLAISSTPVEEWIQAGLGVRA